MEQHDETNPTSYPLGRGYGHDYMRGGEVFGGYGYRDREDYGRTRDGQILDPAAVDQAEIETAASPSVTDYGWAHRALAATLDPHTADPRTPDPNTPDARPDQYPDDEAIAPVAPVPQLEHTYGDSGTAWRHSRSFYVTQAQLQQRLYVQRRPGDGPYQERLQTLRRTDDELRRDVEETLYRDTWVDAQRIRVEVANGTVTLQGDLGQADEVRYAREDAWSVAGVREVRCELRIRGGPRPDDPGDA